MLTTTHMQRADAEAQDRRVLELYSHYIGGRITKSEFVEQVEAFGARASSDPILRTLDMQDAHRAVAAPT